MPIAVSRPVALLCRSGCSARARARIATRAPPPLMCPGQVVDGPRRARARASSWCALGPSAGCDAAAAPLAGRRAGLRECGQRFPSMEEVGRCPR